MCPSVGRTPHWAQLRIFSSIRSTTGDNFLCVRTYDPVVSELTYLSTFLADKLMINTSFVPLSPTVLNIWKWIKPKHADMSQSWFRRRSFRNWPRSLAQTPTALVANGFFYTGIGDRVICFFCGVGLKDWDAGDTPVAEHLRWNAACPFLCLKGSTGTGAHGKDLDLKCRACSQNQANVVGLPCGHICFCKACFETRKSCFSCDAKVLAGTEVFLS